MSALDSHQRRIVREEMLRVQTDEVKSVAPMETPNMPIVARSDASADEFLLALSAYSQAHYRSRLASTCCIGGLASGFFLQLIYSGALPARFGAVPVSVVGSLCTRTVTSTHNNHRFLHDIFMAQRLQQPSTERSQDDSSKFQTNTAINTTHTSLIR